MIQAWTSDIYIFISYLTMEIFHKRFICLLLLSHHLYEISYKTFQILLLLQRVNFIHKESLV